MEVSPLRLVERAAEQRIGCDNNLLLCLQKILINPQFNCKTFQNIKKIQVFTRKN